MKEKIVFASTFLIFPLLFLPLQTIHVVHIYLGVLALILSFMTLIVNRKITFTIIDVFWWFFLLAAFLSMVFSESFSKSLFQFLFLFSTYIIYKYFSLVCISYARKFLFWKVFLLVTLILSIIALFNTGVVNYVNYGNTGLSFYWVYFGHNHIANLLLMAIPITIGMILLPGAKKYQKALLIFLVLIFLLSFLFSFSNGGLIILLIIISISLGLLILNQNQFKLTGLGLGLIIILLITGTGLIFNNQYSKSFGLTKSADLFSGRNYYWKVAINNFTKSPLLGAGLGTYKAGKIFNEKKKLAGANYAHNFFLEMLSSAGILGFAGSVLLILTSLIKAGYRLKKISVNKPFYLGLFIGAIASFLYAMIDFAWFIPSVFVLFWLIIASLEPASDK